MQDETQTEVNELKRGIEALEKLTREAERRWEEERMRLMWLRGAIQALSYVARTYSDSADGQTDRQKEGESKYSIKGENKGE